VRQSSKRFTVLAWIPASYGVTQLSMLASNFKAVT